MVDVDRPQSSGINSPSVIVSLSEDSTRLPANDVDLSTFDFPDLDDLDFDFSEFDRGLWDVPEDDIDFLVSMGSCELDMDLSGKGTNKLEDNLYFSDFVVHPKGDDETGDISAEVKVYSQPLSR